MADIDIPRSIFAKHKPKAAATDGVPAAKVTDFQLAFRAFDTQQSGQLGYRAVKVALRALGFPVKTQEVLRLLAKHTRGSTGVELTVFEAVCSDLYLSRSPEDELQQGFQLFDIDNTGRISLENLSDIVSELGLEIPKSALLEMIAEFDADKDGQISQQEFQYILNLQ